MRIKESVQKLCGDFKTIQMNFIASFIVSQLKRRDFLSFRSIGTGLDEKLLFISHFSYFHEQNENRFSHSSAIHNTS